MARNDFLTEEDVRQLINELIGIEAAAREAADSQEQINRQASDDMLSQLINQEIDDRQKSLSALQTTVNQSITRIDGNVTQLQLLFNQRYDLMTTVISGLNASFEEKVALLDGLRQTVLLNKSNIEIIQGDENTVGSIAKALFDAKAYTDQKIEEVLDGAPALLDTLKELSDALGGDSDFITTVNNSIQEVKDTSAINKQDILDLLSQSLIKKKLVTIAAEHIQQGYVELDHVEIIPDSTIAFINRLGLFEQEDFQMTQVGNKTRFVFINSLLPNANEGLEVGDVLRIKYWTL